MTLYHALEEEDGCPTWDHLPNEQMSARPCPYHHALSSDKPGTGHRHIPKRHWCLLVEIKQCDGFSRYRSVVMDENDEDMALAFYVDNYNDPVFKSIRKGHTMAIMYAHQHRFMDGSYGVRVENLEHVKRKCHGCDRVAPEASLQRCGGCKQFLYCNKDCQTKEWIKSHKGGCKVMKDPAFQALLRLDFETYEGPFSFKAAAASTPSSLGPNAPASTRPAPISTVPVLRANVPVSPRTIAAISLNQEPWFYDMFGGVINTIKSKVTFEDITSEAAALQKISERPDVILITDEGIAMRENAQVWDAVVAYLRSGGTAILMGLFSSMTPAPDFGPLFAKAGLEWESASYHRTTVHLNNTAVGEDLASRLPASYSQKAVNLKNVPSVAAWYGPGQDSHIESAVFIPDRVTNLNEVPAAFGKVGEGSLGYIGDVNNEAESEKVLLAMCGLLG